MKCFLSLNNCFCKIC